ncbi:heme-binding protein [Tropicimonas sp. IMCC34043]|uniref:GlcG/HbpS family heme-binding protein n=1 Tax=Tropicimonas sp. IMCC34043 TaxID=2248760 RepID=UPI000E24A146|nr:heme-binding protein [Tropicimonas sp. IMCC34043]
MQVSRKKSTITQAAAKALAEAAIAAATERGLAIGVCITDAEGAPVALLRMDGVGAPIVEFCSEKAYTSAVTGAATRDFHAHMASSPSLQMGMTGRPRFLVWGGGLPVEYGGETIGGIGISGGTEDQDIEVAAAALAALELAVKSR